MFDIPTATLAATAKIAESGLLEHCLMFVWYLLLTITVLTYYQGRIVFAQDSEGRHVAMKLVKTNSVEYKISRLISQGSTHSSLETFQGILPPVDFLWCDDDHWFIVMPR
jgi:hypothetical protein